MEENFSTESLLQRFACTFHHGPPELVGFRWSRVRDLSGWSTNWGGECDGKLGLGCRWAEGREEGLTSGQRSGWVVADLKDFFLDLIEA